MFFWQQTKGSIRIGAPKVWLGIGVATASLILIYIGLEYFVDEPLRIRMEANLNNRLKGYSVRIEKLDFQPIGFSLNLQNSTIVQAEHPNPPVAFIPNLRASVEWRALLFGRVVADFQIDKPKLYLNRVQLKKELDDKVPLKERGWQEALEAIYPLKIDHFAINGGELTYVDEGPFRPLHITDLNLRAENIRNIRSPEHVYPSKIHLDGVVFGTGTLTLDGNADFLAQPHATFKTAVAFDHVELDYFRPIIARYNLTVRKGTLSATGQMEYAADKKIIVIPK